MLSIYFETYGCSNNIAETEIMEGILSKAGFAITNNIKIADIFVINSCIVKGKVENKIISRLKELSKLRKPIMVAGCMPSVRSQELIKINKSISLVSTHNIDKISYAVKKILEGKNVRLVDYKPLVKLNEPRIRKNPLIAIIPISSGCYGNCTFCTARLAKGRLFSFPENCILKEIKDSLDSKCKEIWLTSQDNASYMLDSGKPKLIELLQDILNLKHKFRLRLGMMNPENVLPILGRLIEIYKNEKIYKFLHIPVQSGSNKVLGDMNRGYKVEDFIKIVSRFRKEIPDITIATDIIAGYPTETQEDFKQTLELIKQVKPEIINLSRFWVRKGTLASSLKQIPPKIQIKRTSSIMEAYKNLPVQIPEKIQKVLVTEKQRNLYIGRTINYKRVIIFSRNNLLGKFIQVKITQVKPNYLAAEEI